METSKRKNNIKLRLECDSNGQAIVTHQYTAQPLGISRAFYPDAANRHRAHLYMTSTSPGLLANDELIISLQLTANTQLYITDQSATKVHSMPIADTRATVHYDVEIDEGATLEFFLNQLFFKDATLEQTTIIKCHPSGNLFWSEIVVPGRLARGEFYDFHHYLNRLQVTSPEGELWFTDATRLEGKNNLFKNCNLFAPFPILGSVIVILPQANLSLLSERLEALETANCPGVRVATSVLPHSKGLLIRAIASGTYGLKNYLQYVLNCVRQINLIQI